MGLLSSAWNAIDPFVPDEQIMGLLGRFRGHQPAQAMPTQMGPMTPPSAPIQGEPGPPAPQLQNPSLGRYLQGFVGGQLPWDVKSHYQDAQRQAKLMHDAGLTPEQAMLYMANPKAYSEAMTKAKASNYEARNIAGGDSALVNGRLITAPKATDNGGVYGWNTTGGYVGTGRAAMSDKDTTEAAKADEEARFHKADEALKAQGIHVNEDQLREVIRHNKQEEGIGWKNANKAPAGSAGGSLPPGFKLD